MEYKQVKEKLEASKMELIYKLQKQNLSNEEKENLQKSIANIDYIIELTDMNHYERG
ncbi:DUF3896 family protein [Cytobacillus suaedae]|nr:DUF3896 family protein [Cytobacillus suaedae]